MRFKDWLRIHLRQILCHHVYHYAPDGEYLVDVGRTKVKYFDCIKGCGKRKWDVI